MRVGERDTGEREREREREIQGEREKERKREIGRETGWERHRYRGEREGDTGEKEREREREEKEKNYKHKKFMEFRKYLLKQQEIGDETAWKMPTISAKYLVFIIQINVYVTLYN